MQVMEAQFSQSVKGCKHQRKKKKEAITKGAYMENGCKRRGKGNIPTKREPSEKKG